MAFLGKHVRFQLGKKNRLFSAQVCQPNAYSQMKDLLLSDKQHKAVNIFPHVFCLLSFFCW